MKTTKVFSQDTSKKEHREEAVLLRCHINAQKCGSYLEHLLQKLSNI